RPEAGKIKVLLEEAAMLASRASWGEGRDYFVLPAMVHLTGEADPRQMDMRTPAGSGLLHRPLLWDVARDNATEILAKAEAGVTPWAMLAWMPLMSGAGEEIIVQRWRDVLEKAVPEGRRRSDLRWAALLFSELARIQPTWERGLKESIMGESQVANALRRE